MQSWHLPGTYAIMTTRLDEQGDGFEFANTNSKGLERVTDEIMHVVPWIKTDEEISLNVDPRCPTVGAVHVKFMRLH